VELIECYWVVERSASGLRLLPIEGRFTPAKTEDRLKTLRGKSESYSDVIILLAAGDA
jgi:hypothetical protein